MNDLFTTCLLLILSTLENTPAVSPPVLPYVPPGGMGDRLRSLRDTTGPYDLTIDRTGSAGDAVIVKNA